MSTPAIVTLPPEKRDAPIARVSSGRILSIDADRGLALLAMFLYVPFAEALAKLPQSTVRDFLMTQSSHAEWHGCTFIDLGFPGFIALLAMSIVISFGRKLAKGATRGQILRGLAVRTTLLFIVGFFFHGGFSVPLDDVRLTGFVPRLAICIFFAGLIELTVSWRWQIVLAAALLLGYWAAMELIPVPGYGAGSYAREGNLNAYVDMQLLGARTYFFLSTPSVVANAVIGLLFGRVVVSSLMPGYKAMALLAIATLLTTLGAAWEPWCPINKAMWTPSFVLFALGTGLYLYLVFYFVIDVLQISRWAFPLIVLGRNPLFSFMAGGLLPFDRYARLFVGEAFAPWLGAWHDLVVLAVAALLWWMLVYWCDRKGAAIRI